MFKFGPWRRRIRSIRRYRNEGPDEPALSSIADTGLCLRSDERYRAGDVEIERPRRVDAQGRKVATVGDDGTRDEPVRVRDIALGWWIEEPTRRAVEVEAQLNAGEWIALN